MANNIVSGANAVVAKSAGSFLTAGINGTNTKVIYEAAGSIRSYVPGRSINPITAFEVGKGYLIYANQPMDLEAYVVPPLTGVDPDPDPEPGTVEDVDFSQYVDANGGPQTLHENGGIPSGATATKKMAKANGNYLDRSILYTGISENGMLGFDAANDANYNWGTMDVGIYSANWVGGSTMPLYKSLNGVNTSIGSCQLNDIVRMEISGDDILVKTSPDGTTFTLLHTISGALSGMANLFIKGMFTATGNNRYITGIKAKGLVAI